MNSLVSFKQIAQLKVAVSFGDRKGFSLARVSSISRSIRPAEVHFMTSSSVRKAWNASRSVGWRALIVRRFVVTTALSLFVGRGSIGSNDLTATNSFDSLGDMSAWLALWRCLGLFNLTGFWGVAAYIGWALVWWTSEPRLDHTLADVACITV